MNDEFKLKLTAEENRRRRGWVMHALNYFHEQGRDVTAKMLQSTLDAVEYRVELPILLADLDYLKQKGYVETERKDDLGFDILVAHIVAKGIDLVEKAKGVYPDPGIILPED